MLLRSAISNEKVAEQVRDGVWSQLVSCSNPSSTKTTWGGASLVASQTIGVATARYVLRLPGISEQPAEPFIADIAPTIQRYIDGPLRPADQDL